MKVEPNIAAGVLNSQPMVVDIPATSLVLFTLSGDALSDTALMDAAQATPGRYVGEILRRLRQMSVASSVYLAINPRLGLQPSGIHQLLWHAREQLDERAGCWLFVDGERRPVAYALTANDIDLSAIHLSLLTCTDATLDARFLDASYGPVQVIPVDRLEVKDDVNAFERVNVSILFMCERATAFLNSVPPAERRAMVRNGQRTAVVGFHAGDVLFSVQALLLENTAIHSIVVMKDYEDVVKAIAPDLECLMVDLPTPYRAGYAPADTNAVMVEQVRFLEERNVRPRFWHFLRPQFRDYTQTRHHLRESMAFAAGGSGSSLRALAPIKVDFGTKATAVPGRVIVHFEAGWELKELPSEQRGELLDLLVSSGFSPIILGKPERSRPAIPAVSYTDLASFEGLLQSAVGLVGSDSFPAHFANLVGLPTVQYFGSTRPHNARGVESARYRYVHQGLPCVPCSVTVGCGLDGGNSCRAQPTSGMIVAALTALVKPPMSHP